MTSSMTSFSINAGCMWQRCVKNNAKQAAFYEVDQNSNDFSSRRDHNRRKEAGMTLPSGIPGSFDSFRKIHILESRLTHRPTSRMMRTSLGLDSD
jgi:hypothetical protein